MYVVTANSEDLSDGLKDIVLDELNIKAYKSAEDASEFISYKLKPQLKTLGPKYGKKLGAISAFLANCDAKKVVDTVRSGVAYAMDTDNEALLGEEDLQIFTESKTGFISASDRGVTVALNTTLTDELIEEGIERELVSKIQTLRKEADFKITDRIEVYYLANGKSAEVFAKAKFLDDVLALSVSAGEKADADICKQVDVNGEKVTIALKKA
jgi:isoleucyl-tRNA synthetase